MCIRDSARGASERDSDYHNHCRKHHDMFPFRRKLSTLRAIALMMLHTNTVQVFVTIPLRLHIRRNTLLVIDFLLQFPIACFVSLELPARLAWPASYTPLRAHDNYVKPGSPPLPEKKKKYVYTLSQPSIPQLQHSTQLNANVLQFLTTQIQQAQE